MSRRSTSTQVGTKYLGSTCQRRHAQEQLCLAPPLSAVARSRRHLASAWHLASGIRHEAPSHLALTPRKYSKLGYLMSLMSAGVLFRDSTTGCTCMLVPANTSFCKPASPWPATPCSLLSLPIFGKVPARKGPVMDSRGSKLEQQKRVCPAALVSNFCFSSPQMVPASPWPYLRYVIYTTSVGLSAVEELQPGIKLRLPVPPLWNAAHLVDCPQPALARVGVCWVVFHPSHSHSKLPLSLCPGLRKLPPHQRNQSGVVPLMPHKATTQPLRP